MKKPNHWILLQLLCLSWTHFQVHALREKPLCTIAAISNPYITALPAEEIQEQEGKSRSWLKHRAMTGMNNAIEAVNKLQPDVFIILGSLTWTGSDDDFIELQTYLDKITVPYYLTYGPKDIVDGGKERYLQHFSKQNVAGSSINIHDVHLQFATTIDQSDDVELLHWMEQDFTKAQNAISVLLFGGPSFKSYNEQDANQQRFWQLIHKQKVAAQFFGAHSHHLYYMDSLPQWTIPSSGWQTEWKLAIIKVYPKQIELSLMVDTSQPLQTLVIPNPVSVARMPTATEDAYGLPSYSEDLALKPELTFIQLSDSQLDDGTDAQRADRYRYAPQMNRVAVEEVNRLAPAFVFMTGDLVNKNTPAEWAMFTEIYSGLKPPFYPSIGNHDILYDISTPEKLEKLGDLKEFALSNWEYVNNHLEPEGFSGPLALYEKFTEKYVNKRHYYTIERSQAGAWERGCVFIHLNTNNGSIDSEQIRWLKGELERTKQAKHMFVFGHYPLLDVFGNNVPKDKGGAEVLALLKEYKVAAYLFGHRHRYAYQVHEGVAHILCDDLCWGEYCAYQIYHVFPDRIVACWKPIFRAAGNRPLYERVVFPEPRYKMSK